MCTWHNINQLVHIRIKEIQILTAINEILDMEIQVVFDFVYFLNLNQDFYILSGNTD